MGANNNLQKAKAAKDDEFYTRRDDIESELGHYEEHFKGKTVYCNCDDPEWSEFFIYFRSNMKRLGIKKLISTYYSKDVSRVEGYKIECVEYVLDTDGLPAKITRDLKGNGDFRNDECIELLKESDIVCTNPPFSLFREYVAQLIKYKKEFLIIGSTNAITYKEIFSLIKENKLWVGVSPRNMKFDKNKERTETKDVNACWFTNLSHKKRKTPIPLWKTYSKGEYPMYDNFEAINVSKVNEIPKDYDGLMGVPITFIEKYNPSQFEIIGIDRVLTYEITKKVSRFKILGTELYARIIIKLKG